ncbi:MAG: redox-regulated ATPase YchF [Phycisphaeraceae bacterium]|nr:redox-regulated ATPase YchF [Phycisphaeraceae bacterium]MBX3408205.1 redox-regulated ATPase YchF [Phycisphaeraceae bacterium]
MEAGIVGLPNVGKSTLFNALTKAGALAANYPFATIEPNVGVVPIPDPRLEEIRRHIESQKIIPAALRLVDIAGIVRGASKGEGLGNKFLSHIREVDAIVQVVRCFEKAPGGEEITHVDGTVDPVRDLETINAELVLADLQTVENSIGKAERAAKSGSREDIARYEVLKKLLPVLSDGRLAGTVRFDDPEQIKAMKGLGMISAKKVLYVANVSDDDVNGRGPLAMKVREWVKAHGGDPEFDVVPVCAKIESELAELSDEDRLEMLQSLGMKEPALNALARAAYHLLGVQSFYTAGPKEIRAWTVPVGATAPQAAGVIHTDFERGFIRAEIYSVEDLKELGTEKAIKDAGRLRVEGKGYTMQDGDVCHFLFNV